MNYVLLFVMWALVAAIPCQYRGLQAHFYYVGTRHLSSHGGLARRHRSCRNFLRSCPRTMSGLGQPPRPDIADCMEDLQLGPSGLFEVEQTMSQAVQVESENFIEVDYWKPHRILNVWSANIFPPNYSFRKVCSCDECSTMIDELNDFAERTRSLFESVMDITSFLKHTVDHCFYLSLACDWSARTLHRFRILLKGENEKLGLQEENKLRRTQIEIQEVIAASGIVSDFEIDRAEDEIDPSCVAECIRFDIDSRGKFYYKPSRVRDVAHALLDQILKIEDEYEALKAEKGIEVDPSGYLERQIKCLEQLPVEQLFSEVVDTIRTVRAIIPFMKELPLIRMFVTGVCDEMVSIRRSFWREYKGVYAHLPIPERHSILTKTIGDLQHWVMYFRRRMGADSTISIYKSFARKLRHPKKNPREAGKKMQENAREMQENCNFGLGS
ncbi:P-loop containing nucleoside triphosphatehydrolases superfamily protein [Striga asiatica]|uniref:P-loop containing nucleoside triphosphatehydrolases superfamily protein n=1 Tax=Striga asiatica TaxID=4170 RepID=A0A5A7PXQ4_STRAF|nr:P-loop containing nucleoside triphosphatehydrolases superfamily protein [Striga asiatica]